MRRLMRTAFAVCWLAATPAASVALAPDTLVVRASMAAASAGALEPSGVTEDAFGRTWVSDAAQHRVLRWDAAGAVLDQAGALGSEPGQFRRPGALSRVGALGVAVLDVENRRVITYDHHLRLLGAAVDLAAAELESRLGRITPVALSADRGGAMYVADAERDRVLVFDFAGTFLRELGGFGARAGGFAGLQGVAAGARGLVATAERPRGRARRAASDSLEGRARVQWLDGNGRVLRSVWTPPLAAGAGEGQLAIALDDSARVAVTAERSGELWVFAADGALLAHRGGLAAPRAVAFAADGALLVAEAGAARVRRFAFTPNAGE